MVDNAALRAAVIQQRMQGYVGTPAYRAAFGYHPGANMDLAASQEQKRPLWWTVLAPLLAPSSGVQSAFAEGAREVRRQRGEEADADTSVPFWEAAKYGVEEIATGKYGDEENAFGAGFAGALKGDEREYTGGRLVEDLYSDQDLSERSTMSKALQSAALDFGLDPLLLPAGRAVKGLTGAVTKPYGRAAKINAAQAKAMPPGAAPSGPAAPSAPVGGPPGTPISPAPAAPGGRPVAPGAGPTSPAPSSPVPNPAAPSSPGAPSGPSAPTSNVPNPNPAAPRMHPTQGREVDPDVYDMALDLGRKRGIDLGGGLKGRLNLGKLIDEVEKYRAGAGAGTPPKPKPQPKSTLGGMTDEQLDAIANDPNVPPATKQAAASELTKRKPKPSQEAKQEQAAVAQELKQNGDLADQKAADELLRDLDEADYQGPAASAAYADDLEARMRAKETPTAKAEAPAAAPVTEMPKAPVTEAAAVTKTRELTARLDEAKAKYEAAEAELTGIRGNVDDITATREDAIRRIPAAEARVERAAREVQSYDDSIRTAKEEGTYSEQLEAAVAGEVAAATKAHQQAVDELESLVRTRDEADAALDKLYSGKKSELDAAAKKRMVAYESLQKAQKAYDEGLAAGTPKPGIPMSLPSGATVEDALKRLGEVQDVTTATGGKQPVAQGAQGMFGEPNRAAVRQRNAGEVPPPVAQERLQNKRAQRGVVNADHQVYGTTRFPTISKAIAAVSLQFANDLRDALGKLEALGVLRPRLKGPRYDTSPAAIARMRREGVHHDLPYDTPADVVLADNIADMTLYAAREEQNLMRYNPLSSLVPYGGRYAQEIRKGLAPVELHSRVTVDIPNKGVTEMPYKLSGEDYWRLVEGESIEVTIPYKVPGKKGTEYATRVVTPEQVKIRARLKQEPRKPSGDNKVPYVGMDEVIRWQDKALSDPKWWDSAIKATDDFMQNPGRYARAQLEEYKRMGERFKKNVDKMRKEWLSTARVATNLPEPALVRAWDAASEYLERSYADYLDQIGRNNYSAAFLTEETAGQLAGILEDAARGYFKSAEEFNLAVATVKARKLTKESIRKEELAKHHDQRALEAATQQDEATATASQQKANTARQEAEQLADQAERELREAQTAFDVSISEKHQAVFAATEPFATPGPVAGAKTKQQAVNIAIDKQLEMEVATFAAPQKTGKASFSSKYDDVLLDQTETIDPVVLGSKARDVLRKGYRDALVDAYGLVRSRVRKGKAYGELRVEDIDKLFSKVRDRMTASFRQRRKPEYVDDFKRGNPGDDGYFRMINRVMVASLSRTAVSAKPSLQGVRGGRWNASAKNRGYRMPTREDIASGNFVNKQVDDLGKPAQSMNYDPGMILDALERSAPQLLRHIYKQDIAGRVKLSDFFEATLWKSQESLAALAKADPELARWAQQFDSLTHAEEVKNIRANRTKVVQDAQNEAATKAISAGVEEQGSILNGYAIAGGVGAAAVAGALAAGLGGEDIESIIEGTQDHAAQVIAGIVGVGAVGLAFASRGKILRYGSRVQKNVARHQISKTARQQAATTHQPTSTLTGTLGTGTPGAVAVERIDPAFKQQQLDEKWIGLFKTNYRMRNIYYKVQNVYDRAISLLNDSESHYARVVQLSKDNEEALANVIPQIFTAKPLDQFSGVEREILEELRYLVGKDFYGSEDVAKYTTGNGTLHRAALDPERIRKNLTLKGSGGNVWAPPGAGGPKPKATWEDAASGKVDYWKVVQDNIIAELDPKNPLATLEQLRRTEAGLMGAINESMVFDDLLDEFGSAVPKEGYVKITGGHPYLEGMYLHKDIVPEVQQLVGRLNKIDDFKVSNKFMASWDVINRAWKTQVTIYRPAHHIRNYTGDMFNFWVDAEGGAAGVIRDTQLSWRLLGARGANKYMDSATGEYLPARDVQMYGRTRETWLNPSKRQATAAADIKVNQRSVGEINGDEILNAANDRGLLHGAPTLEDIALDDAGKGFAAVEKLKEIQPFGGQVRNAGSMASVYREHSIRIAHFVNAARSVKVPKAIAAKGREASLKFVFDEAAQRTRKYHPDGLDMTPFERRVMRRAIPFYSWMRKATPLVFNAYFFKPYAVTALPKMTDSLTYGSIGDTERGMPSDEAWTDDQLATAPWITKRIVAAQTGALASIGYYGPSNPYVDQTREILGGASSIGEVPGEVTKMLAGGIRPDVRVPLELLTNTRFAYGAPISRQPDAGKKAMYAFEQSAGLAGEATRRLTSQSGFAHEALNWATAAGRVDFSNSKYFAIQDTQNRMATGEGLEGLDPSQDPNYQAWLQQMGLAPRP